MDRPPFPLYLTAASFGRTELFDLVQFITQIFIGAIAKEPIAELSRMTPRRTVDKYENGPG